MTYVGKIRAKDINTGKVKYFDSESFKFPNSNLFDIIISSTPNNKQQTTNKRNKQMGINREIRVENIIKKYSAKVEQINKEVYEQLSREDDEVYVKLEVGPDTRWYMKMFVPFDGYTHIAKYYDKDGVSWSYASELTAEEKENAPGFDWNVDGQYAKYVGIAYS